MPKAERYIRIDMTTTAKNSTRDTPKVFVGIAEMKNPDAGEFPNERNPKSLNKELFRAAAYEALKDAGIEHKGLRFSSSAGCSCGCSPGFIVLGRMDLQSNIRVVIAKLPSDSPVLFI